MSRLADQVRTSLREEMSKRHISGRTIEQILGGPARGWSRSQIQKVLSGGARVSIDFIEGMCFALGVSVVEIVRDRGLEFVADLTPLELRFLQVLRELDPQFRDSLFGVLDVRVKTAAPERYAMPPKNGRKRRTG